ncbi:MAG: hypothetical protein WC026_15605 [Hyphomicrobium sp.]|uniref:hypothetical protein n=1 Tax=Hyphomicrobium sp. TaxID=82 RepID=UPI003567B5ED
MTIPPNVIEAASVDAVDVTFVDRHEATARRVILALAESLPESAVEKACAELYARNKFAEPDDMRAALVAALKDIVEGE